LNAFVANSQARNGLVSAQTSEAMIKAAQAKEQMTAWDQVHDALIQKGFKESDALLVRGALVGASDHSAENALKALGLADLGSPTSTPTEQTLGQQMYQGKGAAPVAVQPNFEQPQGGMYGNLPVQQTPNEQATTSNLSAEAELRRQQSLHPELFHPNAGGANGGPLSDDAKYNAAQKYNMWGVLPPLGMGTAARNDRKDILDWAATLSGNPNWHPPSWDGAQPGAPAPQPGAPQRPGASPAAAPGAPPLVHPTPQTATNAASNSADFKAQQAMLTDQTKRTANADASEATAIKQMQIVRDTLAKADQFGSPYANSMQNLIRNRAFGDPNVSSYQNSLSTMRTEYARVISLATGATGITDFAMKMGQDLFPDDLAPAQFEANAAVAQREMAARTGSMHEQIAGAKNALHTPLGASQNSAAPQGGAGELPSYPDEATARAAGHRSGERVKIGGVSGTLN
jgi:hypothetical protein